MKTFRRLSVVPLAAILALLAGGAVLPLSAQQAAAPPPTPAAPQTEPPAAPAAPAPATPEAKAKRASQGKALSALTSLLDAIKDKQKEIKDLSQELKEPDPTVDPEVLAESLEGAKEDLKQLQLNLEAIATGVAVGEYRNTEPQSFDLQTELVNLLQPLVYALKSATRDSRQIETLRQGIEQNNKRIRTAEQANRNLAALAALNEDERLAKDFERMQADWRHELDSLADQNQILEQQLQAKQAAKGSFLSSTGEAVSGFLRNRGLNFILGMVTFMVVFGALRFLGVSFKRLRDRRRQMRSSFERLTELMLRAFSLIAAFAATLVVFNLRNEWLLLGISVLFLVALGWVAIKSLPTMREQFTLLLNLGSVREGERLIYDGLPWRVASLNLYSHLVNPALTGGSVHLAIRDLVGMVSRSSSDNEPWFPSLEGDWVKLDDDTIGEVLHQSPEMVEVRDFGGCRKIYTTQNYLGLNPANLSRGYRIQMIFGIDYMYQKDGAERIPNIFKANLTRDLIAVCGEDNVLRVEGDFFAPNASSLDYEFEAYIRGEGAHLYEEVERTMIYCFINTCNENDWVIPFQQVTVHGVGGGS